jgi:hypothetical protein
MFIEMIDLLRCVNDHQDSWLVASFRSITNRIVVEGTLGCPICSAEYEITNGVADFTRGEAAPSLDVERAVAAHGREDHATRAGAYLDATHPGATIVLGGIWAHAAQELAEIADVRIIAINPPSEVGESERVGLVRVGSRIPLAPGSVQGVALDAWFPPAIVDAALRAVKSGGRIVGPASIAHPGAVTVLAHDDNYWVAEKPAEMVSISRSRQATSEEE